MKQEKEKAREEAAKLVNRTNVLYYYCSILLIITCSVFLEIDAEYMPVIDLHVHVFNVNELLFNPFD